VSFAVIRRIFDQLTSGRVSSSCCSTCGTPSCWSCYKPGDYWFDINEMNYPHDQYIVCPLSKYTGLSIKECNLLHNVI
jgi:hypothetical protein